MNLKTKSEIRRFKLKRPSMISFQKMQIAVVVLSAKRLIYINESITIPAQISFYQGKPVWSSRKVQSVLQYLKAVDIKAQTEHKYHYLTSSQVSLNVLRCLRLKHLNKLSMISVANNVREENLKQLELWFLTHHCHKINQGQSVMAQKQNRAKGR